MSAAKLALARAIENKVASMDMAGLLELAATLKVRVPAMAKAAGGRGRKPPAAASARGARVLQGAGIGPVVSASAGRKLLNAITIDDASADWVESELAGAGDLVRRLKISRGTLDNWRKANKIIALPKGLRNFLYPLRQFDQRRSVPGLDRVVPFFASPEEAWGWLVTPNRMTGGKPPVDKLREGEVALVVGAAEGALDYA
jgi:hypothetical protein